MKCKELMWHTNHELVTVEIIVPIQSLLET